MRTLTILAAFGLFINLIGCTPTEQECTVLLQTKFDGVMAELASSQTENLRLTAEAARLHDLYETPETLSIDEVSREYTCLYVAQWNVFSYYDEAQNHSPGIAYDFAVVPVLEEHPTMVKSFTLDKVEGANVVTVVWFPKMALTADYKATAYYQSGLEGETAIALDNTDPFTCRGN